MEYLAKEFDSWASARQRQLFNEQEEELGDISAGRRAWLMRRRRWMAYRQGRCAVA